MPSLPPSLRDKWVAMSKDSVLFANLLLPVQPHPGQVAWLRGSKQAINTLVPGNRWGKSTVEAIKHIHKCMFKVGAAPSGRYDWLSLPYETISAAHSADQAEIVFNTARRILKHPAIAPFVVRVYETPFPRIVFWNRSVFHCRSAHDKGKYIDGHQYRYVSIDEAGWIPNLKELVNGVVLMRLAGGGELDLVGTPKGYGDLYWYYTRGARGVEGYYSQRGSIFDNPHLSPEDIKMRDALLAHADHRLRAQVVDGDFVSMSGMAFTKDQLDRAFDPALPAHQDYVIGHRYVQAWDLGRKTDFTVGITLDVTERPYSVVDFTRLNKVPWEEIYSIIARKSKEYHVYQPRIDASGPGGDVVEEELTKRGVFVEPYKVSNHQMKLNLINTLQSAFDYGRESVGTRTQFDEAGIAHQVPDMEDVDADWGLLRIPAIPQIVDELGVYQLDDKDLVTDSVMALAMAVELVYDGALRWEPSFGSIYGEG